MMPAMCDAAKGVAPPNYVTRARYWMSHQKGFTRTDLFSHLHYAYGIKRDTNKIAGKLLRSEARKGNIRFIGGFTRRWVPVK